MIESLAFFLAVLVLRASAEKSLGCPFLLSLSPFAEHGPRTVSHSRIVFG